MKREIGEISAIKIRANLNTRVLGSRINVYETIDSTSTYLKVNECQNGEVVVSTHQSAGRGRRGREFISSENKGIYFSFALSYNGDLSKISNITICVAVAVVRALKNICDIDVDVKWVNDIFLNNKKLAGILTELVPMNQQKNLNKLIIGVGINTKEVDEELMDIATSIKEVSSCTNFENDLISEILNIFEYLFYEEFQSNFEKILSEYKSKLFFLGREVRVLGLQSYDAIALDVDARGELIVEDIAGNRKQLDSGEISIKVKK